MNIQFFKQTNLRQWMLWDYSSGQLGKYQHIDSYIYIYMTALMGTLGTD